MISKQLLRAIPCILTIAIAVFFAHAPAAHALSLDDAFAALPSYKVGEDDSAPTRIRAAVLESHGDSNARNAISDRLAAVLTGEATWCSKSFAAEQLCIAATEKQVPAIAPLLKDERLSDLARYALQNIPGEAAEKALLDALRATEGAVRIGIINSLAERASTNAVSALLPLLGNADLETARAAAQALGASGNSEAAMALLKALQSDGNAQTLVAVRAGLTACAGELAARGKSEEALGIFNTMFEPGQDRNTREAGLAGLVKVRGERAADLVAGLLVGSDAALRRAALGHVALLPGKRATEVLARTLEQLDAQGQVLLASALAERGDPVAAGHLRALLASEVEAVRAAAASALGTLDDGSAVPALIAVATSGDALAGPAARAALERNAASTVNASLAELLSEADAAQAPILLDILAARSARESVPQILVATRFTNKEAVDAAFAALGTLATPSDYPAFIAALAEATTSREAAEQALARLLARSTEGDRGTVLATAFEANADVGLRISLLKATPAAGDSTALTLVRSQLVADTPVLRAAAQAALAAWPTREASADLAALLNSSDLNADSRSKVFDGYVRLLRLPSDEPKAATIQALQKLLNDSQSDQERLNVISGLGETADLAALDILDPLVAETQVGRAAALAGERVRKAFYVVTTSHNPEDAKAAIDREINTRWTSKAFQTPGMWFQLDMAREAKVETLVLDSSRSDGDYPRAYAAYVFNDPENMGEPIVTRENDKPVTEIPLKGAKGRYIRIVQTGTAEASYWSVHELTIFPN